MRGGGGGWYCLRGLEEMETTAWEVILLFLRRGARFVIFVGMRMAGLWGVRCAMRGILISVWNALSLGDGAWMKPMSFSRGNDSGSLVCYQL
jgi:hypothetical protein